MPPLFNCGKVLRKTAAPQAEQDIRRRKMLQKQKNAAEAEKSGQERQITIPEILPKMLNISQFWSAGLPANVEYVGNLESEAGKTG